MSIHAEHRGHIDFYTRLCSRNEAKIVIVLEELGLQYTLHDVDSSEKTFNKEAFFAICPNGNVPALTDILTNGDEVLLTGPASIVQYVINRYDQDHRISYPKGSLEDTEINNWFFSGMSLSRVARSNHMAGQEAPQKIPYGIEHFGNKTFGLFSILNQHLDKTRADYIAGTKCTIADIAQIPFMVAADALGVDIGKFPKLNYWYKRMLDRPAVAKGLRLLGMEPVVKDI